MIDTDDLHRWPGLTTALVAAELARERRLRASLYPDRVAKRMMTADEADYQLAIIAAIASDWHHATTQPGDQTEHGYTHAERIAAVARELDYRRRLYPRWISTGRVTQADATHQLACLEAVDWLYRQGWGWRPAYPDATADQARNEWRTISASLSDQPDSQKELAL